MSKVISAHAVSVDGYISGRDTRRQEEFGRGLGDAPMLFDWYFDGDTPSQVFDGFKLSEPSARFFDALAARDGAAVAGRTTYEHSSHFGTAAARTRRRPSFVLSHRPAPEISETQTLVTTGIEDAIAAARAIAGDKDVALMGGGVADRGARRPASSTSWSSTRCPSCSAAVAASSTSSRSTCISVCSRPSRPPA